MIQRAFGDNLDLGMIYRWFSHDLEIIQASFRNDLGIIFSEMKRGGSGGRSPPGKQAPQ